MMRVIRIVKMNLTRKVAALLRTDAVVSALVDMDTLARFVIAVAMVIPIYICFLVAWFSIAKGAEVAIYQHLHDTNSSIYNDWIPETLKFVFGHTQLESFTVMISFGMTLLAAFALWTMGARVSASVVATIFMAIIMCLQMSVPTFGLALIALLDGNQPIARMWAYLAILSSCVAILILKEYVCLWRSVGEISGDVQ